MSDDPKSPSHDEPIIGQHTEPHAPSDLEASQHDPAQYAGYYGTAEGGEYAQAEEPAETYEEQGYYEAEEGYAPEQGYESGQSYEEQAYTPPPEAIIAPAVSAPAVPDASFAAVPTNRDVVAPATSAPATRAAFAPVDAAPIAPPTNLKHIAPRQAVRNVQKRQEEEERQKRPSGVSPSKQFGEVAPSDSDSKLLALTHQLQELIANKKEGDGGNSAPPAPAPFDPAAPLTSPDAKVRRGAAFKQSGTQPGVRPPPLAPLVPIGNAPTGNPPPVSGPTPLMAQRPPAPAAFSGPEYTSTTPWLKRIVYFLLAFGLLAGIFAAGRLTAPESNDPKRVRRDGFPTAPSANAWSDNAIAQLDQVLAADQNGEMDAVFRMAYNLKSTAKNAAGMEVYLANIESRRENYNEAEALLSQAATNQDSAAINDQFGYSFTRRRDFEKATLWLTRAAADNPFSPDIFYRLAEALRRQGNLQQAVDKFHQCLLRMPVEAQYDDLREWTMLKMRLAQLELGKSTDALRNDVDAHLNQPNPSGYWMLTSAALYLQGGDMASAAEMLGKARSALGASRFDSLLSDYYFRAYADREQIGSFFSKETDIKKRRKDSRTAYFVDP